MSIGELVQKLPSNVFFDFLKAHYQDLFEFFGKVLKIFHIDTDKLTHQDSALSQKRRAVGHAAF